MGGQHYRTLPAENTGIAGGMGGLISLYAGFREPEVFSRLGVFPGILTADPIFGFVETSAPSSPMRVPWWANWKAPPTSATWWRWMPR